ncbi:MAG: formylglycine-generating enzyme family protein [Anaerolineae bacterium]|nr:formylglycine-generating enzyme family protein [Anaerolineae bacterium]
MTHKVELWVAIPPGRVLLETGGYLAQPTEFAVAPFLMGRFPVTNAQFALFVDEGGYRRRDWWCDDGWARLHKERWSEPRFWHSREWNRPNHPVVGVSWYEAMAFCRWRSAVTGQAIRLPTEQQWQRAAQGDTGYEFPWGNDEPSAEWCNWNRVIDATTPVDAYPDGASPLGVMDMSGNVREWCLTGWESGTTVQGGAEVRMVRGGSWSNDSPISLRAANRSAIDPNTRLHPGYRNDVTVGFRCAIARRQAD